MKTSSKNYLKNLTQESEDFSKISLVELKGTPTVIISAEIQDIIDQCHNLFGATEWNGFIYFSQVEGDISNPDSLILEAKYIDVLGLGEPARVDTDINELALDFYDKYPESEKLSYGCIHTH